MAVDDHDDFGDFDNDFDDHYHNHHQPISFSMMWYG